MDGLEARDGCDPSGSNAASRMTSDHRGQLWRLHGAVIASEYPFRAPLLPASGPADLRIEILAASPDSPATAALPRRRQPLATLHLRGGGWIEVWPDRIAGFSDGSALDPRLEIALLSHALAIWLEDRGAVVLHASAVAIDGSAIALAAANGVGKTSLAAALCQAGGRLLADDMVAVRQDGHRYVIAPGYPEMRMWPDTARRFYGPHFDARPMVLPGFPKYRIPIGPPGIGRFQAAPAPLGAIYVLERGAVRQPPTISARGMAGQRSTGPLPGIELEGIDIAPCSPAAAVGVLMAHCFAQRAGRPQSAQASRLERLARLVEQVPVRKLRLPDDGDRLAEVAAAVLADARRPRPGG